MMRHGCIEINARESDAPLAERVASGSPILGIMCSLRVSSPASSVPPIEPSEKYRRPQRSPEFGIQSWRQHKEIGHLLFVIGYIRYFSFFFGSKGSRILCLKLLMMKACPHPRRVDQGRPTQSPAAQEMTNNHSQIANDKFYWERPHFFWTPNFAEITERLRRGLKNWIIGASA